MPIGALSPVRQIPRGRWLRLCRDRRGTAIVEFALCGGLALAMLLAMLNVSFVFFAQQSLQTAAEAVGRKVMTGQITSTNTNAAAFRQAACASLPSVLNCSRLYVDVRSANKFSGLDMSGIKLTYDKDGKVTNSWNYAPGDAGQVVVLRLLYRWPITGVPQDYHLATEPDGTRILLATTVIKTEFYS